MKVSRNEVMQHAERGLKAIMYFDVQDKQVIKAVKSKNLDKSLACAFALINMGDDKADYDLSSEAVTAPVQGIHEFISDPTMEFTLPRDVASVLLKKITSAREEMQKAAAEMHFSHPAGTVKKLASQLGVSISEIRRQKAAGTLDAFIKEKQQPQEEVAA